MGDAYASGNWQVRAGEEDEFVSRWTAFLEWTRENAEGFGGATLIRSAEDQSRFISFAEWTDMEAQAAWRSLPEWQPKMGACRELCDEFVGGPHSRAAAVTP
jgi:heme-degrading monooxygenase HmoA